MQQVDVLEKFSLFHKYWQPKIVGELSDQYIKLAKLKGSFLWHTHEKNVELFLVITGKWTIYRWQKRRYRCCCLNRNPRLSYWRAYQ